MDTADIIGFISIVVQLIFLEGILSIDNAAVLGAMVSVLPPDKPVPYPAPFKFLQGFTNRTLGLQQAAALKVGLLGAYLGRALMLVLAAWVIANPFLKILGAAYLIKLAFEHLGHVGQAEGNEADEHGRKLTPASFWLVVLNVELADLAFSLDNVVAAVALSSRLWVVMLGVALGIIIMRFAASIFTWMIRREPILETAAYIIVLNIGVELLLAEFLQLQIEAWEKFLISGSTLVLGVVYARLKFLHTLAPVLRWLSQGMGHVNDLVNWALRPALVLIKFGFILTSKIGGKTIRQAAPSSTIVTAAYIGFDPEERPPIQGENVQ